MKSLVANYSNVNDAKKVPFPFLKEMNENAYARISNSDWPSRRSEKWKYTSLAHLKNLNFHWNQNPSKTLCEDWVKNNNVASNTLYLFNGHFVDGVSDQNLRASSIIVDDPTEKELLEHIFAERTCSSSTQK